MGARTGLAATAPRLRAHPDVILAIGTKDVLYHTRDMAWGGDTRLYRSHAELRAHFPAALASTGVRVLKQHRGNGGNGVWKVAPIAAADAAPPMVRVTHAQRGSVPQLYPLDQFMAQCAAYFDGDGPLIDQPFALRLADGMVRCYMVGDAVVGFGEQKLNALLPAAPDGAPTLPGPRVYFPPTRADFQPLKTLLEGGWLAQLCARMGVAVADLPLVWDADFLFGPKTAAGDDTYVLCEINVSCVYPFPDSALDPLAELLARRLDQRRR